MINRIIYRVDKFDIIMYGDCESPLVSKYNIDINTMLYDIQYRKIDEYFINVEYRNSSTTCFSLHKGNSFVKLLKFNSVYVHSGNAPSAYQNLLTKSVSEFKDDIYDFVKEKFDHKTPISVELIEDTIILNIDLTYYGVVEDISSLCFINVVTQNHKILKSLESTLYSPNRDDGVFYNSNVNEKGFININLTMNEYFSIGNVVDTAIDKEMALIKSLSPDINVTAKREGYRTDNQVRRLSLEFPNDYNTFKLLKILYFKQDFIERLNRQDGSIRLSSIYVSI